MHALEWCGFVMGRKEEKARMGQGEGEGKGGIEGEGRKTKELLV